MSFRPCTKTEKLDSTIAGRQVPEKTADAKRFGAKEFVVNQDGAVPAALGALQRVRSDRAYDEAIARGLQWVLGHNELHTGLIDTRWCFVARAIEQGPAGVVVQREMYAYQPARFIFATLSDPVWAGEVLA